MSDQLPSEMTAPVGVDKVEGLLDDFRRALPPHTMWLEVYTDCDEGWDIYVNSGDTHARGAGATLADALKDAWADLRGVDR